MFGGALNVTFNRAALSYYIRSRLFQWRKDVDGDLSLVVGGVVALTKHKDSTIISFPGQECWPTREASKWQGRESD